MYFVVRRWIWYIGGLGLRRVRLIRFAPAKRLANVYLAGRFLNTENRVQNKVITMDQVELYQRVNVVFLPTAKVDEMMTKCSIEGYTKNRQ